MIALFALSTAHAYENGWGHWFSDPTFRVLSGTPQVYKDQWELVEAAYAKSPSAIHPKVVWDDDNGWGRPNWENEIALVSTSSLNSLCGGAGGACALGWWDNGGISEYDILFTSTAAGTPWEFGTLTNDHRNYDSSGGRPFLCTAMHEMGHGLGLSHENDRYNIMGADWNVVATNGSTFRCEIGSDAMLGLVAQNGFGASKTDFGVSHFVYAGKSANPAYSAHRRGSVFDTPKPAFPLVWFPASFTTDPTNDRERVYDVTADSTIWFEYTVQNASTVAMAIPVDFVLSTNSTIDGGDAVLGSAVHFLGAGQVYTAVGSIHLPYDAAIVPDWYLGVRADPSGSVAESLETNNSVYVARLNITL